MRFRLTLVVGLLLGSCLPCLPPQTVVSAMVQDPLQSSVQEAQHEQLCQRGKELLGQQKYSEAIAAFNEALRLKRDSATAYKERGNAYLQLGDLDRAMADYQKAVEVDPDFAPAYNNIGLIHQRRRDTERAAVAFQRAIQADPKLVHAHQNLGDLCFNTGDYEQAVGHYTNAIRIEPERFIGYTNRGAAHLRLGKLDLAVADSSRAIKLNPKYALSYNNRARVYMQQGQIDRALVDLDEAIKLNPNLAFAYYNRGRIYLTLGKPRLAEADYAKAKQLDPNTPELSKIGGVMTKRHNLDTGWVEWAVRGAGAEHRDKSARIGTLIAKNRLDEANHMADDVIESFATLMSRRKATYVCVANREELDIYRKEHPGARNVVWLDWSYRVALHGKALIAVERGQLDVALTLLNRQIEIAPYAGEPYGERGYIHIHRKQWKKALSDYRRALELAEHFSSSRPGQGATLRGIGYCLIELNDLPGARKAYERSLMIEPDSDPAKQELEYIKKLEKQQQ